MRLLSLLVLGLVFLLPLGCREALVDGQDPDPDASPALPSTASRIYLKGPNEMQVGRTYNFRGEPRVDIVRYAWSYSGTGDLSSSAARSARTFDVRAESRGTVRVVILGYDDEDVPIAAGERIVPIR